MTPQRFRSSSVREALAQARATLGPSALVLGTRLVPAPGWRGWLGGRDVELSAFSRPDVSKNRPSTSENGDSARRVPAPAPAPAPVTNGLVARLMATGLDRDLAEAVADAIPTALRRDVSQGQIRQALASCLGRLACRGEVLAQVNVFIGPPGVGKTTTIAKIAAQARARGERRFRLVAADGYRVGAVEQLRLYADIIGSPFVVARTAEEVTAAVAGSRLPVLVDTPGLSPANEEAGAFFAALSSLPAVRTHLVVPATTSPRDFERIWERFALAGADRVVISKVDEAETVMPLVRAIRERDLQISLIGLGQRVPEDLAEGDSETIAACLLGQLPAVHA
jgi:flagellar biosynthesis protein FlhF